MKHGNNNGMDVLLRNVGRKQRSASEASVRESEERVSHLDADELNAYAEGKLPAATRSRYTAHVADCSRCRNTLTQLILAAGVVPKPVEQPLGATLWLKLRELFSPQVLRYAIPAFAVLAVVAVGVVVMRQEHRSEFVARNEQVAQTTPEVPASGQTKTDNNSTVVAPKPQAQQPTSAPTGPTGRATSSETDQKAGTADSVSVAKESPKAVAQESPKSKKEAADQPTFAPEAAAPAPPAAKEKVDESAKRSEAANKKEQEAQRDEAAKESEEEKARSKDKAVSENRQGLLSPGVATRSAKPLRPGVAGAAKSAPSDRSRADKDTNESETRSVAGREFRRQNGIWVDTAYQSGRATTDVARNSEQYRALVADEPDVRKIADQLDGEVIVVWKGKTYRIH